MASLDQLLVLQEHDTVLDQLRHRRATLPQRAEAESIQVDLGDVTQRQAEVAEARAEVARAQKRLEDEVASVEEKVASVHGQLYGGGVTSPRELQALQDDENALKRHQSAVEDKVIEQMELAVPLDEQTDELAARRAGLEADETRVAAELIAAEAEIDAEVAGVVAERADIAAAVDAELLERYEGLRHDLGGIAVARLVGTNCGGCHLTLSAVELDRIRHQPDDVVVLCEECGRLLVR
jgi:uncharacterized protein